MKNSKYFKLAAKAAVVILFVMGAFAIARLASENLVVQETVRNYGYVGVFIASIVSGFNVVVPVPIASFMPLFLESGLNFWVSVAIITLGVTVGDTVAYFVGRTGRTIITGRLKERVERLEAFKKDRFWLPLILLLLFACFAPFPNEVLVVPMAIIGYRLSSVLPVLIVGNAVFNTYIALGFANFFDIIAR